MTLMRAARRQKHPENSPISNKDHPQQRAYRAGIVIPVVLTLSGESLIVGTVTLTTGVLEVGTGRVSLKKYA